MNEWIHKQTNKWNPLDKAVEFSDLSTKESKKITNATKERSGRFFSLNVLY